MKTKFYLHIIFTLIFVAMLTGFLEAKISNQDEVQLLKQDLLEGKLKVGKTRLKDVVSAYGEAPDIVETKDKITFDYGDLRLEFEKNEYFRDWEYDYSHTYAFKDEIDDLRFDLEDYQIVGDFHSYKQIVKDYEEPTEAYPKKGDGEHSVYYWGELKLTFENVIVLSSWRGKNLKDKNEEVLGTK